MANDITEEGNVQEQSAEAAAEGLKEDRDMVTVASVAGAARMRDLA
jgi:hypothetical protein